MIPTPHVVKSRYVVECVPELGTLLLYSTFSGSVVSLDEYESVMWMENKIDEIPEVTKNYLFDQKFIIDPTFDECADIIEQTNNYIAKHNESHYRIIVTTCCNARCAYCFEKNLKQENMSASTALKVADYIISHSKDHDLIELEWFGGEPLMQTNIISMIYERIKTVLSDKKIKNTLITNGSLIDDEVISLFKKLELKHIQITIDGTEDIYNKTKRYIDKKYDFNLIISNVHLLIKNGIKPTIRINIDDENVYDTIRLIDYLHDIFGDDVSIYASHLFELSTVDRKYSVFLEGLILKKLIDYHYIKPESLLKRRKVPCTLASFKDNVVINPDGGLIKCCESLAHSKNMIGDISVGTDKNKIKAWCDVTNSSECMHCVYFPVCLGGCKASQFGYTNIKCFNYKCQIEYVLSQIYFQKHEHKNHQ